MYLEVWAHCMNPGAPSRDVGHCWQEVGFHPLTLSGWGWEVKATAGPQAGSRLGRACPHSPTAGLGASSAWLFPATEKHAETWPEVSLSRPKLKGETAIFGGLRGPGTLYHLPSPCGAECARGVPAWSAPRCSHPQGPFV